MPNLATVQIIAAARARSGGPVNVAIVGLGTGTLACYVEHGDSWTYYEIDPAVVSIARDPNRFTYLAACAPDMPIVLGDARLTLADAPDGSYDVILIDAFTSDTMPAHLMTREAMAVYLRKLKPDGIVALHVSSRYMELVSVVAGIAQANGLIARLNHPEDVNLDAYQYSSAVVAAARTDEDFATLATSGNWIVVRPDPRQCGMDRRLLQRDRRHDPAPAAVAPPMYNRTVSSGLRVCLAASHGMESGIACNVAAEAGRHPVRARIAVRPVTRRVPGACVLRASMASFAAAGIFLQFALSAASRSKGHCSLAKPSSPDFRAPQRSKSPAASRR